MIWQPRLGCDEDEAEVTKTESVNSNIEGLNVQMWPDFTAKKKAARKKKAKAD